MSRRRSTEPNSNGENGLQAATLASVSRTGMNPQPSGSNGQGEEPNPLTSFAQHVLGTNNNHLQSPQDSSDFLGLDNEGEIFTQEPAQGFEELLESDANRPRNDNPDNTLKEAVEVMDGLSHEMSYQGEMEHEQSVHDHGMGQAPPPPERTRRGKRRREDEETNGLTSMAGGEGADGELDISLLDPVRMKKDSHKEVERRRRENINDGINELAKYVPGGMDKGGKGAFLRRAAEYLGELSEKVRIMETEYGARESNHDLQAQVNRLQAQLVEEQERSIRYETSWREAEDRAAASQFQLARVEQDLRYLETEREM